MAKGQPIAVTKQRDIDERLEIRFEYEPVEIGKDLAGRSITSIVTKVWVPTETPIFGPLGPEALKLLIALRDLVFADAGVTPKDPTRYDRSEVTPTTAAHKINSGRVKAKLGLATTDAAKKAFERRVKELRLAAFIDVDASPGKESQLSLRP